MAILKAPAVGPGRVAASALLLCGHAVTPVRAAPPISLDALPTLVIFTPVSVEWDPRDQTLWVADQYLPRIAHVEEDGAPISILPSARAVGTLRP